MTATIFTRVFIGQTEKYSSAGSDYRLNKGFFKNNFQKILHIQSIVYLC
jgi:hypothetical protein